MYEAGARDREREQVRVGIKGTIRKRRMTRISFSLPTRSEMDNDDGGNGHRNAVCACEEVSCRRQ